jgi:peptidyl-prolyl cis-trans isomerase C
MKLRLINLRIFVCITILFAVLSPGCARKTSEKSDANVHEATPTLNAAQPDTAKPEPNMPTQTMTEMPETAVAVTVNGIDIMETDIEKAMEPEINNIAKQNSNLPPALIEQLKKQLRARYIDQLIREQLLSEQVRDANIVTTDEEITNQINQLIANQPEPMTLEEFKEKTTEYGMSFDEMKEDIRKRLSYRKLILAQWEGKIDVNEADAKKFYDENPKEFQTPEQVSASHILIKPDPNVADPNQAKAQAKAKAEDLLKQLKDGAEFADLAKLNSACPSSAQGGDLGFFARGQMTPPFEEAAFKLELGQLSDIVETEYGYHIIKSTGHKDAGQISFEQAKDSIIKYLTQEKQQKFINDYIDSLKAKANIVYPEGKEPPTAGAASEIPG